MLKYSYYLLYKLIHKRYLVSYSFIMKNTSDSFIGNFVFDITGKVTWSVIQEWQKELIKSYEKYTDNCYITNFQRIAIDFPK